MKTIYTNNELYHYGIPGMKWGVRKNKVSGDSGKQKSPIRQKKEEYKQASKNRRSIPDDELNQRIQRLQKEKQLKDLTDDNVSPGKKKTEQTLERIGVAALTSVATAALIAGGAAAIKMYVNKKTGTPIADGDFLKAFSKAFDKKLFK